MRRSSAACVALCLATLGCKPRVENGALLMSEPAAVPTEPPILVFFGGYDSCARNTTDMSMIDESNGLRSRLQAALRQARNDQTLAVTILRGCYRADGIVSGTGTQFHYRAEGQAADQVSRLGVLTLEADRAARPDRAVSDRPDPATIEAFFAPISTAIETLATGGGRNRPVFLVGHSFGGWTAMHVAFRLPRNVNLRGTFTIDPISRAECTPNTYLNFNDPWCRRFPTFDDIGTDMHGQIRGDGRAWHNFYQTRTVALHSSISNDGTTNIETNRNTELDPPRPANAGFSRGAAGHHSWIWSDARVWSTIETEVRQQLGLPANAAAVEGQGFELTEGAAFEDDLSDEDVREWTSAHGEPTTERPIFND